MAWKTSSTACDYSAGGGENNPMLERLNTGVNNQNEGDMWREECGVVGIFGDPEASRLCYLALHALQHRGQEGAGIVTSNNGTLHTVTGKLIDRYTQLHKSIALAQIY
jgi:glutamate synthase domain-containing protein 1